MIDQPYLDGYAGPYDCDAVRHMTAALEQYGAQAEHLKRAAVATPGYYGRRDERTTADGHVWLYGYEFHTTLDWVIILIPRVSKKKGDTPRTAERSVGLYSMTGNLFAADSVLREFAATFRSNEYDVRRTMKERNSSPSTQSVSA